MRVESVPTFYVRIYISGPIEVAKQVIREACAPGGLCVTVEPTTFIYKGGEEVGYVVGLLNYPRFPLESAVLLEQGRALAIKLLEATFQQSVLLMTPTVTEWYTLRP